MSVSEEKYMNNSTVEDSYNRVLEILRESNLHFLVKETPYAVKISIKKRLVSENNQQQFTNIHQIRKNENNLKNKITILENRLKEFGDIHAETLSKKMEKENEAPKSQIKTQGILQICLSFYNIFSHV